MSNPPNSNHPPWDSDNYSINVWIAWDAWYDTYACNMLHQNNCNVTWVGYSLVTCHGHGHGCILWCMYMHVYSIIILHGHVLHEFYLMITVQTCMSCCQ